jgi:glycosyltransferase 2 family protein
VTFEIRKLARITLTVLLVAFCVWCAVKARDEWRDISLAQLAHAVPAIAIAAVLSLLNYALRAFRWRLYLERRGHRESLSFAALTYVAGFAFTLSPAKVGEFARVRYYIDRSVPARDVAGVLVVERLVDVVTMLMLSTLLLITVPAHQGVLLTLTGLALIAMASLTFVPWQPLAERVAASQRLPKFVSRSAVGVAGVLQVARILLRPGTLLVGLLIGLVAWGLEGVGLYLLTSISPSAQIGLAPAVGIYAVAVVAGAATFLPGGLLGTEAMMAALLVANGFPLPDAALITLVCRLVTLWLAVGLGWLAFLFLETRSSRALSWR